MTRVDRVCFLIVALLATILNVSESLTVNSNTHNRVQTVQTVKDVRDNTNQIEVQGRRKVLLNGLLGCSLFALTSFNKPALAKVEGYAPPSKSKPKSIPEEYRQGTFTLSGTEDDAPISKESYTKLPSGLVYADIRPGTGETVTDGSKVNLQWVLRKSDGYFVDSSEVQNSVPFIFTVGDTKAVIQGVDEGVRGMKQAGTRRLLIPISMAYVQGLDDGKPGPLPAGYGPRQQMRRVQTVRKDVPGEYIFLEVQATRVR